MTDQLLTLIRTEIGEAPTAQQVVEYLTRHRVLKRRDVRPFIIHSMFWSKYKGSNRTARDVEEEIAVYFDISRTAVMNIRLRYSKGLSGRK